MADHPLILASGSPRRRELLARAGIAFEVMPAEISEVEAAGETPEAHARRLAADKALAVARRVGPSPRRLVLGADTVVVIDGATLGKPRDADHAVRLLEGLVGRTHEVITAIAIVASDELRVESRAVRTRVSMRSASAAELRSYVATGEPLDKAGAYAVQGEGRRFVEAIEGSESNVIGLPVEETLSLLDAATPPSPGS